MASHYARCERCGGQVKQMGPAPLAADGLPLPVTALCERCAERAKERAKASRETPATVTANAVQGATTYQYEVRMPEAESAKPEAPEGAPAFTPQESEPLGPPDLPPTPDAPAANREESDPEEARRDPDHSRDKEPPEAEGDAHETPLGAPVEQGTHVFPHSEPEGEPDARPAKPPGMTPSGEPSGEEASKINTPPAGKHRGRA